jgi:hypothetical protein
MQYPFSDAEDSGDDDDDGDDGEGSVDWRHQEGIENVKTETVLRSGWLRKCSQDRKVRAARPGAG